MSSGLLRCTPAEVGRGAGAFGGVGGPASRSAGVGSRGVGSAGMGRVRRPRWCRCASRPA